MKSFYFTESRPANVSSRGEWALQLETNYYGSTVQALASARADVNLWSRVCLERYKTSKYGYVKSMCDYEILIL